MIQLSRVQVGANSMTDNSLEIRGLYPLATLVLQIGETKPDRSESWQSKTKQSGKFRLANRYRVRKFLEEDLILLKDSRKVATKAGTNLTIRDGHPNERRRDRISKFC